MKKMLNKFKIKITHFWEIIFKELEILKLKLVSAKTLRILKLEYSLLKIFKIESP